MGGGAGRKTTHFEDDTEMERKTQKMNRTYSGGRSRRGGGSSAYDDDMLERKTVVFGEDRVPSPKHSKNSGNNGNNGNSGGDSRSGNSGRGRKSPKNSKNAKRGNRRTSFMAVETIKQTYDAIIESPTKGVIENTRLHKTLPAVLEGDKSGSESNSGEDSNDSNNENNESDTTTTTTNKTGKTTTTTTTTTTVKATKKGHRRRATTDMTRAASPKRNTNQLSPTSETRQARAMLTSLFDRVIQSCDQNQINVDDYLKKEFLDCGKDVNGNDPSLQKSIHKDNALTYEQFMAFLINMETLVAQTLNVRQCGVEAV